MPATFVLSGVRSPRTMASSVTCSVRPPSQAFQFRVMVIMTAAASNKTMNGVAYLSQGHRGFGCGSSCAGREAVGEAGLEIGFGVEAAAMVHLLVEPTV